MNSREPEKKPSPARPAGGPAPRPHRARPLVLVVDDDESALAAIARLIRSAGYRVQTFPNAEDVLAAKLRAGRICLVTDLHLPAMNGVNLCRELARSGRPLPTILITGRNDHATLRLAEQADAVTVLFKPIDEGPLLQAIMRCLNH